MVGFRDCVVSMFFVAGGGLIVVLICGAVGRATDCGGLGVCVWGVD